MGDVQLNVLVLDDEAMVLQALTRALRSASSQWKVHFSTSIDECWELLELLPIDVVISDMQMPGTDGAAFLESVMERYPHIARFMLSGFKDKDVAVDCAGVHQFLLKPIMVTHLVQRVTFATLRSPEDLEMRRLVYGTSGLITSEESLEHVRSVAFSSSARIPDLADAVCTDPAVTAKVLQIANSNLFGQILPGADIEACLLAIGTELFRRLIVNDGAVRSLPSNDLRSETLKSLLTHAREVASRLGSDLASASHAMRLAGLLHVAGSLINLDHVDLAGSPHCENDLILSRALLGAWGIPGSILDQMAPELCDPSGALIS